MCYTVGKLQAHLSVSVIEADEPAKMVHLADIWRETALVKKMREI